MPRRTTTRTGEPRWSSLHAARWWPGVAAAIAILAPAAPAAGAWVSVQRVTIGTAQVLDQGELTFGVVSPLAYGLSQRLTVQTHPILDLLLVPNFSLRYKMLDGPSWVLSMTAEYKQSFFNQRSTTSTAGGEAPAAGEAAGAPATVAAVESDTPGEVAVGPAATFYLSNQWAFSAAPVYALRIAPGTESVLRHGVAATAQVHWLWNPDNLVMVTLLGRYDVTIGAFDWPVGTIAWVHDWGSFHVIAGLSVGEFPIGDLFGQDLGTWPVLPMLDFWWRY